MKYKFIILLLLIVLLGFGLRIKDYAQVPSPDEDFDEVHYAWGGASWIKEGTPRSWSYLESYKDFEYLERYGQQWRVVKPLIEKPPLYFWLSGMNVLMFYHGDIFDVDHQVIRVLPIFLGLLSILLVGLVGRVIFSSSVGLVGALLFATIPSIVLANRLSLTENLLAPIMLAAVLLLNLVSRVKTDAKVVIGICAMSFFGLLTKQIGIVVAIASAIYLFQIKKLRIMGLVLISAFSAVVVFLIIGAVYDFKLLLSLQNDIKVLTLSGLPEIVQSIFRFPGIGAKNRPFYDGAMLGSFLLFFTSPLWLIKYVEKKANKNVLMFLLFPFTYLVLMVIGASGAGSFSYFNRYSYPLYPFIILILGYFLITLYKKFGFYEMIFSLLVLGSSTIRFAFLFIPRQYQYLWQNLFIFTFAVSFFVWFVAKNYRKHLLIFLFVLFIVVNILVDINLVSIYPAQVEKLSEFWRMFR